MPFLQTVQQRLRALVFPSIVMLCLGYLGYHTVHGDRGVRAWIDLSDRLERLKREEAAIRAQHNWLLHRASLLQMENPDPDMLDEMLRRRLYLARPDEIVIRYRSPLPDE